MREKFVGKYGSYNVLLVQKGDAYGRNDELVWDRDEPLIEFFLDVGSFDFSANGYGHFVSRYYLSQLLSKQDDHLKEGICLDGGHRLYMGGTDLRFALQACSAKLGNLELRTKFDTLGREAHES